MAIERGSLGGNWFCIGLTILWKQFSLCTRGNHNCGISDFKIEGKSQVSLIWVIGSIIKYKLPVIT